MTNIGYPDLRKLTFLKVTILVAALLAVTSCVNENEIGEPDLKQEICKLELKISINEFDSDLTRSDRYEWQDGDKIYLSLNNPTGNEVSGTVEYDIKEKEWNLTTSGLFPEGEYNGKAIFVKDKIQTSSGRTILKSSSPVYVDIAVKCIKNANMAKLTVSLHPQTGRLRIKGEEGSEFSLVGLRHIAGFDQKSLELLYSDEKVDCHISTDGYTDYVYALFPETSRDISIQYESNLFTTTLSPEILKSGISGYLDLPTINSHTGWQYKQMSVPMLGNLKYYNLWTNKVSLSSSIYDNGNGNILKCGFCYSKSPKPTVEDFNKVCVMDNNNSFAETIISLTDNTTYYFRAYAENEFGIGYSEEIVVTTIAVLLPELTKVSVSTIQDSPETNFVAQVVSNGNSEIKEAGFVYSTHTMPDISDTKLVSASVSELSATTTDFKSGTRYYVRAYAINEKGVGYGEQTMFIGGGGRPSETDIIPPNI